MRSGAYTLLTIIAIDIIQKKIFASGVGFSYMKLTGLHKLYKDALIYEWVHFLFILDIDLKALYKHFLTF